LLLIRNRLILGIIKKIISLVLKVLYKIIALLNLQLPLLVALIGIVLYLVGVFDGGGAPLAVFGIAMVISVVIAILGLLKKLLGLGGKVKKGKGMQIVNDNVKPQPTVYVQPEQVQVATQQGSNVLSSVAPKYFRVKQNPNYVMAEYPDRYELYRLSNGNMIKVRTDYK